jgi:hypothetical protein
MLREFIGDHIEIDGRMIAYRLVTASDYLSAKGLSEQEIYDFQDNNGNTFELINQIMAIKQSCWLLRRTKYSCQSLSDNLFSLKNRLIKELKECHWFDFDDDFVERDGEPQQYCKICHLPMITCYDKTRRHGTYYERLSSDHIPIPKDE